jgi:hypothetical protein
MRDTELQRLKHDALSFEYFLSRELIFCNKNELLHSAWTCKQTNIIERGLSFTSVQGFPHIWLL